MVYYIIQRRIVEQKSRMNEFVILFFAKNNDFYPSCLSQTHRRVFALYSTLITYLMPCYSLLVPISYIKLILKNRKNRKIAAQNDGKQNFVKIFFFKQINWKIGIKM